MSHVSHKLKNSIEGALAGGGDPATSPLYVFGPFLKLIVVAGVARVTFGASVWLVVITIAVVSAMYRLVMQWITDGSGGSGLSEEEFGGWAVKVNASITFIEYTLTFLVSMSAMVTFIADRVPVLNSPVLGLSFLSYRTIIAVVLSVLTGWLVNRGPKMAARTFGPATAGVLLLLWTMVVTTIVRHGLHFPDFNFDAFRPEYLHLTLGGYVRILAVMTGVEVFANLVAAYEGTPAQRSNKAFYSLVIIMGTTAVTMLVVGPVIYAIADPTDAHVSVFTQAMDYLLPSPLPYLGTLVGIAVLMSASAASAQGLQNLALGLTERRYIPPRLGEPNRHAVANRPVWIQVGIVCFFFLVLGTHEETYLSLYAAGVFILLSMTGWAVAKRLFRNIRTSRSAGQITLVVGTIIASSLTSGATIIIFTERFLEGAWTYLIFIPMLYAALTYFRKRYGDPSPEMDYLGQLDAAQLAGFGFGQVAKVPIMPGQSISPNHIELTWLPDVTDQNTWYEGAAKIQDILVLLDGSENAARALPIAGMIAQNLGARITLLSAIKNQSQTTKSELEEISNERADYLNSIAAELATVGIESRVMVECGSISELAIALIRNDDFDLVVAATRGGSGKFHWSRDGLSRKLVEKVNKPVLLVQVDDQGRNVSSKIDNILVALDGSTYSERVLPYARLLAKAFDSRLILLCVSAVPEADDYRAPADIVLKIREKAEVNMYKFLNEIARLLRKDGLTVDVVVQGSIPAHAILEIAREKNVDLLMLTSQGRGGYDALLLGSVAEYVVQNTGRPVFMLPIQGDKDEADGTAGEK